MSENCSLQENMIDRNWVSKRKRKRISSGIDVANGKASLASDTLRTRSLSFKRKLKGDINISQFGHKLKGHDGYFFECEKCDLGGNLLCCDTCPRTYHLECLNPPLKRAPSGKWYCPSCFEQKDDMKPSSNVEANTRRARSKSKFEKSRTTDRLSGDEKPSLSGENSMPGNNKLNNKEKSILASRASPIEESESSQVDISYIKKSSPSSDSGLRDGIPTATDIRMKKKPDLSDSGSKDGISTEADIKVKKKSNSSSHGKPSSYKENQPLFKMLNSETSDIFSKGRFNLRRSKVPGRKHALSVAQSSQPSKKDRLKSSMVDKKKRSRSRKAKETGDGPSQTSKITSLLSETCESFHKRRESDKKSSEYIPEEKTRVHKSLRKRKHEISHEAFPSSLGLDEHETINHHDNIHGVLQVDRILGCRLQTGSAVSSCPTQTVNCDVSPVVTKLESDSGRSPSRLLSCDLIGLENHDRLLEDSHDGNEVLNMKDVKRFHHEGSEDWSSGKKGKDYNNALAVEETFKPEEIRNKNKVMLSSGESSKDCGITCKRNEYLEESALNEPVMQEITVEKDSKGIADVELVSVDNYGDNHLSVTRDSEVIDLVEAQPITSAENITQGVQNSGAKDESSITYELLVKWAGQSNIHNSWLPESQLKIIAKRKLENYKAKYGTSLINICEEKWCEPQRVIALRVSKNGIKEALTKWHGLTYDECTWERLDEPVIGQAAHLVTEFEKFQKETLEKDARDDISRYKDYCQEVVSLTEQPKELQGGSLFPHQLEALNWLRKCWHKSRNVILADEMGLGKTVSACAFLSSLYLEFKAKLPCLVLVPLSTMPNWMAEFALWAPHLNVVEYHGPAKARSIIRQFEWHATYPGGLRKVTRAYKFNVLLTTYEMVLVDSSHLRGIPWEVLMVDEGHRLKNSGSKLFNLLNSYSFQHRVLLTGTPLQNNIGEMYNLLNFLQPVSFPSLSAFEEKFNDLTTAEKVDELKKLVAPHMLRRLKKDAMQNIPPKTERMVPVELTSIQAEYYRAMLTKNYQILRNVGRGGAQQSMLNIVMQLRKVCNHPYLIPGTEPESGSIEFLQEMRIKASAKLTLLHSMLKILHKEGHRVLLFSQMTKLLDILEDYLVVEYGPKTFERVDGSVPVADRQTAIARFNQDKSRFVFLLSTRSCGLGINLATADTVIIYDSDFNPHADIQAMNRAHRIGQSNRLLVYRLVVRASVEERILQLAKKKLMLDQLFVNKSESQKEVEDILRWGTEELFNDNEDVNEKGLDGTSATNKLEIITDKDPRHRRRSGGLGDVYKDRCTDGTTKIVWDENAISKLLDRSNLQSSVFGCTDGDMENDMLGSVKSVDWNDEVSEDPVAGDGCEQSPEAKEDDAVNGTEGNEWDRLLQVRWEKYQIEEEAVLGRGKRLRKPISYKETFAPIPTEVLGEPSANEEDDPEPLYTAAGRALKEKYAKLRARQKERISQRHNKNILCSVDKPEPLTQSFIPSFKEEQSLGSSKHLDGTGDISPMKLEEPRSSQPSESKRSNSTAKVGRSKHGHRRYLNAHWDPSAGNISPDIFLPSHQFQSTDSANPMPSANLLPVLGLCAPNASQVNSTPWSFHSPLGQPLSNPEQRKGIMKMLEVPCAPSTMTGSLNDVNIVGQETAENPSLPDLSGEALRYRLKNTIPDFFPFCPPPPTTSGRLPPDLLESSRGSCSTFQERLGLPNLSLDEKAAPRFPLSSKNVRKLCTDFLPSLSLGTNMGFTNCSSQDVHNIPLVPNFTQQLNETLKKKQKMEELPPMLGLGQQKQATNSSLPENHKKVLDNILMRTQYATSKLLKKKLKMHSWSEDELDALWIGVRRHGRGNWDAMLRDPKLNFTKHRSAEDLSTRWIEEQCKIMDGPIDEPTFTGSKSSKSPSFISDGMMTRALLGSRFSSAGVDPPKFRSHLTDIQLASGELTSVLSCIEPTSHLPTVNEGCPPLPTWLPNNFGSSYSGEFPAGPFLRPDNLNLPFDQAFQQNSILGSSFGSLNTNLPSTHSTQNRDDSKKPKLPSFLDRSLNLLRDAHNGIQSANSSMMLPPDLKRKQISTESPTYDESMPGSSKANTLPHWLREAVNVSPSKSSVSHLPPTVSAIAQSVRLLYGEDQPTIPPFSVPGPPPPQPKDPRKILKKKRKLQKLRAPEIVNSMNKLYNASSSTIPTVPPIMSNTPDIPRANPSPSLPSLNLNLNSPSSSFDTPVKELEEALSPNTEECQLVTSCVASRLSIPPAPSISCPSCEQTEFSVRKDLETSEQAEESLPEDMEKIEEFDKIRSSDSGDREKPKDEQMCQAESGDSSKSQSDQCGANQTNVEESSLEKTVLDNHKIEQEQ
ncbi:protein CHROMATIN REMODELING 4-like [Iris pallida]|uniref:Protein CHROMATIN REMODELING 4-like n=1 Tax=Iris pallida TaxID=29817 RepID=A0AAX6I1B9_IRIPA|nr:protein CHROMATIN REMODELING 4-like [Iris pallida]